MRSQDPNRREFSTWAAAAVGGLLAGLSVSPRRGHGAGEEGPGQAAAVCRSRTSAAA